MEHAEHVTRLPNAPLPDEVTIDTTNLELRMTPNQMRALKAETGRTLEELVGEGADDADRMQAMAWLELRRQGFDARWSAVGDVAVVVKSEAPDPTSSGDSTSSPRSAATGG